MSSREMKNIRLEDRKGYVEGRSCHARGDQPDHWVQKAFSHNKGALHRELDVKPGQKIPEGKLEKAAHSKNPTLRKRAQLAENARHFNHK